MGRATSGGVGMASMMDEMQKTLARRRAKVMPRVAITLYPMVLYFGQNPALILRNVKGILHAPVLPLFCPFNSILPFYLFFLLFFSVAEPKNSFPLCSGFHEVSVPVPATASTCERNIFATQK
jgi:hypothetical protein